MSITYYFTQPDLLAPQTKARSVDINALSNAARAAFDKIPVSDQAWTGTHDFTAGALRVKTPVISADAASKGYVDARLVSGGLMPAFPAVGTYLLYSINGALVPQAPPAADINSSPAALAQAQAIALSF